MKSEAYARVTEKIINDLEKGLRPWFKPWNNAHTAGRISKPLRANGVPYRGINVLILWSEALEKGYAAPLWLTFKQVGLLGGVVRRGEKSVQVVYATKIEISEKDEADDQKVRRMSFLKRYSVFNAEQTDGLPQHFYATAQRLLPSKVRLERADRFCSSTGAEVRHGGNFAYYTPMYDRIQMPPFDSFFDVEGYYGTLAHELVHWTSHRKRLKRDLIKDEGGEEGRAMEELVAEIGSAFLSADLDITPETGPNHASYVDCWLKILKGDVRAVFMAAAHAQRAADYLHSLQPSERAPLP